MKQWIVQDSGYRHQMTHGLWVPHLILTTFQDSNLCGGYDNILRSIVGYKNTIQFLHLNLIQSLYVMFFTKHILNAMTFLHAYSRTIAKTSEEIELVGWQNSTGNHKQ